MDTPQGRLAHATNELAKAKTPQERFYALGAAAKESFVVGNVEDAKKYAHELMTLLPNFPSNWNYGNAVQDANLVLGRVALKEGHVDEAKQYLIAAGNSPGSPQMDSFGPNVSFSEGPSGEGRTWWGHTIPWAFSQVLGAGIRALGRMDSGDQRWENSGFWTELDLLIMRLTQTGLRQQRDEALAFWATALGGSSS
jgi:hypothetical protein